MMCAMTWLICSVVEERAEHNEALIAVLPTATQRGAFSNERARKERGASSLAFENVSIEASRTWAFLRLLKGASLVISKTSRVPFIASYQLKWNSQEAVEKKLTMR